jgi:hypothetical protein
MAETPDFAQLLGPFVAAIPDAGRPGFLAMLERAAASRYRQWAAAFTPLAKGLLECAAREEEIAAKAERLFPPDAVLREAIAEQAPGAQEAFGSVFAGLPVREQMRLQAGAERQGAAAWRGLADLEQSQAARAELLACAGLEEASAEHLEALLADPTASAPLGD